LELPIATGWGISEAQSGNVRGAGIEPWGVRNYVYGDSLRHVHWRSTARTGHLLVKEFEAGTHAAAAFVIQATKGSDVGPPESSSLELMKGHGVFLAETFLRMGARVEFSGLDRNPSHGSQHERLNEIYEELAGLNADLEGTLLDQLGSAGIGLAHGSILFVLLAVADDSLPTAISSLSGKGISIVPLLYNARSLDGKTKVRPATDPAFLRELRAAGASPLIMPLGDGHA
jgi:uncharacterized protein (DUF58 family)